MKRFGFILLMLLPVVGLASEQGFGTERFSDLFANSLSISQTEYQQRDIPLVILDIDLGSSTDDLFALQMLCRYADESKCKILGVICDRVGENNGMMADLMLNYYGHPEVPVGVERNSPKANCFIDYCAEVGDSSILMHYQAMGYKVTSIPEERPDGWVLYRRLLSQAPDSSVDIVCLGFMTTLSHLMNSKPDTISSLSGVELVERKVKKIYVMGSKLTAVSLDGKIGYNFGNPNSLFADTVFRLLPETIEVELSPSQVGKYIGRYEDDSVLHDIADYRNPIYQVYKNFTVDSGQYMWDVLPVIQCVEGDRLFRMSERGRVRVIFDGVDGKNDRLVFVPDRNGRVRFQYIPFGWTASDKVRFRNEVLGRIRSSY